MISIVVFDMAGTTVNEDNVVYKTVQAAINKRGYDVSLEQVLEQGAGKEKLQAIKSVLEVFADVKDDNLANEIFRDFKEMLAKAYADLHVSAQPHAEALFQVLRQRNIRVVLNTGYDIATAESLVAKLGWTKGLEFDSLITASDVKNNRPNPDMILLAMENFGITDGKQVVKVGDSIIDIEEGQNAGCGLSIGITTGAHTYGQLQSANPDFIIDDLLELPVIIDQFEKQLASSY